MTLILQFKWGNKAGNVHATTSKGHKTLCNWCKLWGLRNSGVRALKTRACLVRDTPGELCGDDEIWVARIDRWDLVGCKGYLGKEERTSWVRDEPDLGDGREHSVSVGWQRRRPAWGQAAGSDSSSEDVPLIGDTGTASWGPRGSMCCPGPIHSCCSIFLLLASGFGSEIDSFLYWLYLDTFIHICTPLKWEWRGRKWRERVPVCSFLKDWAYS